MGRSVRVYVAGSVVAATAAYVVAWWLAPANDLWVIAVLAAACLLGVQLKVRRFADSVDVSFNWALVLAALPLGGPAAAMAVAATASLLELRSRELAVRMFNTALGVLPVGGAAVAYWALGGRWAVHQLASPSALVTDLALPLLSANVVLLALNAMLLAGVVSLDKRIPYREVAAGILRSGGLSSSGYGIFGLLLVVLWDSAGVGPLAAVLVLAPLFIARWAFAQYAEQNAAHERTVAALVQAVEAKDHYTRGHSERVAKASVIIGRTVGLSQQRTSTLHFAGMLHDVGKLGVPTRVLQKTGALTDEEFAAIARHPVRGLEMVRDIEFLGEAFEGILHHHERLDGRGYPMGLAGTSIPEFARIIAVADAFDSMTSTRSYRQARSVQEAMAELQRCSGTQFDPPFVQALTEGVARAGWEVTEVAQPDPLAADALPPGESAPSRDHDDPAFSIPRTSLPRRRRFPPGEDEPS